MITPQRFISHYLCINEHLFSEKIIEFFPDGTYTLSDFSDEISFTLFCDGVLFVASIELEPDLDVLFSELFDVPCADLPTRLLDAKLYKKYQLNGAPWGLYHCFSYGIKRLL